MRVTLPEGGAACGLQSCSVVVVEGSLMLPLLLLCSVSGHLVYCLQTPGLELFGSFPAPSFSFLIAGAQ